MNFKLIALPLLALSASLLLAACASPAPAASVVPGKTAAAPAKTNATPIASNDGSTIECDDEASTGSNIKRHKCHRETEESRRLKREQIDAMTRTGNSANKGPGNQ